MLSKRRVGKAAPEFRLVHLLGVRLAHPTPTVIARNVSCRRRSRPHRSLRRRSSSLRNGRQRSAAFSQRFRAPIWRCAGGGIILSSVATRYQLGLFFHAGALTCPALARTLHEEVFRSSGLDVPSAT